MLGMIISMFSVNISGVTVGKRTSRAFTEKLWGPKSCGFEVKNVAYPPPVKLEETFTNF